MGLLKNIWKPDLEKLTKKSDINGIIRALAYEDPNIQTEAAKILGEIGNPIAIKPLTMLLKHSDKSVRESAAQSLGVIGDETAVSALVDAMLFHRKENKPINFREDSHPISDLSNALKKLKHTSTIEPLLLHLNTKDLILQLHIIDILSYWGDPRAIEPIYNIIKTPDGKYNFPAIKALVKLDDKRAVELVLECFDSLYSDRIDSFYELDIIEILGNLGDYRCIDRLLSKLNSFFEEIRYHTISALANYNDVRVVNELINLLNDSDSQIVCNAIYSLRKLNNPKAVSYIANKLNSDCEKEKEAAISALNNMGTDGKVALNIHILLHETNIHTQIEAIQNLGKSKDERALQTLLNLANRENLDIFEYIVIALGELGNPLAVWKLSEFVRSNYFSHKAAIALGKLDYFLDVNDNDSTNRLNLAIDVLIEELFTPNINGYYQLDLSEALIKIYENAKTPEELKQKIKNSGGRILSSYNVNLNYTDKSPDGTYWDVERDVEITYYHF